MFSFTEEVSDLSKVTKLSCCCRTETSVLQLQVVTFPPLPHTASLVATCSHPVSCFLLLYPTRLWAQHGLAEQEVESASGSGSHVQWEVARGGWLLRVFWKARGKDQAWKIETKF